MKDLTGQRFDHLTVLQPTTMRKNGRIVWACRCDCGKRIFADSIALQLGYTKSCGCLKAEQTEQRMADYNEKIAGQRFGRLTIVRATDKREGTSILWECKCDCGNTTYSTMNTLTRGAKKSCGCLAKEQSARRREAISNELIGQRFGRLTVLHLAEERVHGATALACKCDCGNLTLATSYQLKQGTKRSCGCLLKENREQRKKDHTEIIPGQRFGHLTVLRLSENRVHGAIAWECLCDCGNTTLAREYWLKNGIKKSCGCMRNGQQKRL